MRHKPSQYFFLAVFSLPPGPEAASLGRKDTGQRQGLETPQVSTREDQPLRDLSAQTLFLGINFRGASGEAKQKAPPRSIFSSAAYFVSV